MNRRSTTSLIVILSMLLTSMVVGCSRRTFNDSLALTYDLPTSLTIGAGEFLPGSDIQYLGTSQRGARLLIGGQEAVKRTGDSLDWRGNPAEGAAVELNLRVLSHTERTLTLAGLARITVQDADPRPAAIDSGSPITFSGLVGYGVGVGDRVPGSTVSYLTVAPEGAHLDGIEGYPYRRTGDSIVWEGSLRPGVAIALQLRVVQYDEDTLRLAGTVSLWFKGQ